MAAGAIIKLVCYRSEEIGRFHFESLWNVEIMQTEKSA